MKLSMSRRQRRAAHMVRWRDLIVSTTGVADLASVMVSVIVVGVIAAGATVGVLTYLPWAQDNAAHAGIASINSAEQSSWTQHRTYLTDTALTASGLLKQAQSKTGAATDRAGSCYVAMAKSASGKVFYATDTKPTPVEYTAGSTTDCATTVSLAALAGSLDGASQLAAGDTGPTPVAPAPAPVGTPQATPTAAPTPAPTATASPIVGTPPTVTLVQDDWNNDGHSDLLARLSSNGNLSLYTGNGSGGWANANGILQASSFGVLTQIVSAGDFNGDGQNDVIAIDSGGDLWLYPGKSSGGFGSRSEIGTGWSGFRNLTAVRDFNCDGTMDLATIDPTNRLILYPGNGKGGFLAPVQMATGFSAINTMVGIGDFNGDGKADLIARDTSGNLFLYPGTGTGSIGTAVKIGTGWSAFSLITSDGDFNGDKQPDVLGVDGTGNLKLYTGNGTGGWANASGAVIGTGWNAMNWIG